MFGFYEKLDWDLIGSEILLDSFFVNMILFSYRCLGKIIVLFFNILVYLCNYIIIVLC